MEKLNWTQKNDKLLFEFVKNNIENNNYYEYIRKLYNEENADRNCIINDILYCYDDVYNGYYSIYTIMDSIEDYATNNELEDICIPDIVNAEDFEIKEF